MTNPQLLQPESVSGCILNTKATLMVLAKSPVCLLCVDRVCVCGLSWIQQTETGNFALPLCPSFILCPVIVAQP